MRWILLLLLCVGSSKAQKSYSPDEGYPFHLYTPVITSAAALPERSKIRGLEISLYNAATVGLMGRDHAVSSVIAILEGEDRSEFRGLRVTILFPDGLQSLSDISGDLVLTPIIRNLEEFENDSLPRPLSATAKLIVTVADGRFTDFYPDADLEVSFIRVQDFKPASKRGTGR